MTHHKAPPPSHPPAPSSLPSQPTTEDPLAAGHLAVGHRMSNDSTHFQYSHLEAARNGGIPIFTQERLEERQKRRGDAESTEKLPDDVSETGTLHVAVNAVHVAVERLPRGAWG